MITLKIYLKYIDLYVCVNIKLKYNIRFTFGDTKLRLQLKTDA